MSASDADTTYVAGWEEIGTHDGYRIVGCRNSGWFVQAPPYNRVIAHPPAHLTVLEALCWFLHEQSKNERNVAQ
jgi:hypothetical protein